jgi:hypothetical protein
MLYLMMHKGDNEYLVKVGYTTDTHKRRSSYRSHNPRAIMRSACAGQVSHESSCHWQLIFKGGKCVNGTEWYSVPKELFDILYEKGMGYFRPNYKPIHFLEDFK